MEQGCLWPRVSVVVPVRDDAAGLRRCLEGLRAQSVELEIIVVDDGSSDDSAAVAKEHGARVLETEGRGAAAARNLGIRAASGDVILFTDADCIPHLHWAQCLLAPLMSHPFIATKGTYVTRQGSATARFVQMEYEQRYARMRRRQTIDFLDSYSLAVRRWALYKIGGFDEVFRGVSVEDQELGYRLQPLGEFRFVEDAVVEHRHAATLWSYLKKKLRIGRGKATLLRRHLRRAGGDSHTPATLRWQVPLALAALPLSGIQPWAACLCAAAPLVLSLPLVGSVLRRHGLALLPMSVLLAVGRGWALALGFAWGMAFPSARLTGAPPASWPEAGCKPSEERVEEPRNVSPAAP